MPKALGRLLIFAFLLAGAGCDSRQAALETARTAGTIEAYESFLNEYPETPLALEVAAELDSLRVERRGYTVATVAGGQVVPRRSLEGLNSGTLTGLILQVVAIRPEVKLDLSMEAVYAQLTDGTSVPLRFIQPISHRDAAISVYGIKVGIPRPYGGTIMTRNLEGDRSVTMYAGYVVSFGKYTDKGTEFFGFPLLGLQEDMVITYDLLSGGPVEFGLLFDGAVETIDSIIFADMVLRLPENNLLDTSKILGQRPIDPNTAADVSVGAFTVNVPSDWRSFSAIESDQLRRQYMTQSEEISRQYSGASDSAESVDIAAFHIGGDAGTFAIVSFAVPPQSDLVNLLKNQAEEKAKWGIQQGYIQKYLGLVPLDDKRFSGFYVKFIGTSGEVQISGGLEHKKLKNTLVQLTLLSPNSWDEQKATNTLNSVLESLKLAER